MSDQKRSPRDFATRTHTHKTPIPYIPLKEEIRDKVTADPCTFKVKVDGKTTTNASVWTGGTQASFLIHVIGMLNYCNRKKLFVSGGPQKTRETSSSWACKKAMTTYVCPNPTQVRERVLEAQETSPKKTFAGTITISKKNMEIRTNTLVPAEEAPEPEAEELDRAQDAHEQVLAKIQEANEKLEKTGTAIFDL